MPLQNRVTPLSQLVAVPERGLLYGNRGCLHDSQGHIRQHHNVRRWIACQLEFRGWDRGPKLQPGRFTELFFLDDATALAAGHRPCALCRRADYNRLLEVWRDLHPGEVGADAIDLRLHRERVVSRAGERRFHEAQLASLPDGTFVLEAGKPHLVFGSRLTRWTPAGYLDPLPRSKGDATVITPPSFVELLRGGWEPLVPFVHPTAIP